MHSVTLGERVLEGCREIELKPKRFYRVSGLSDFGPRFGDHGRGVRVQLTTSAPDFGLVDTPHAQVDFDHCAANSQAPHRRSFLHTNHFFLQSPRRTRDMCFILEVTTNSYRLQGEHVQSHSHLVNGLNRTAAIPGALLVLEGEQRAILLKIFATFSSPVTTRTSPTTQQTQPSSLPLPDYRWPSNTC